MIVEPGRFHWREERMSLPGFAAEASLSRTGQVYRGYARAGADSSAGTVEMALPPVGRGTLDCCCGASCTRCRGGPGTGRPNCTCACTPGGGAKCDCSADLFPGGFL